MKAFYLFFLFISSYSYSQHSFTYHLKNTDDISFTNNLSVNITNTNKKQVFSIQSKEEKNKIKYSQVVFTAPKKGWINLRNAQFVNGTIHNKGDKEVKVVFYVKANRGWGAVSDEATIKPNESKTLECNLLDMFPDGATPKIDRNHISLLKLIIVKAPSNLNITLSHLTYKGVQKKAIIPKGRLEVPDMILKKPTAGLRVKYKLDNNSELYFALFLPKKWTPKKKLPIIVEFPGNEFYTNNCYSSGSPEDCTIGYGMSKGNAIWVSLPFVNYKTGKTASSGWGNPEDTVDYTLKVVDHIIKKFNGDPNNVFLTGFSRGAIACGFIGLRNKSIANTWKGIHMCQHYDGDGWGGSKLNDAILRLQNLNGTKIFHTDNIKKNKELQKMLADQNVDVTSAESGLNAHACAMFLDNRPSTLKLRKWYQDLLKKEK